MRESERGREENGFERLTDTLLVHYNAATSRSRRLEPGRDDEEIKKLGTCWDLCSYPSFCSVISVEQGFITIIQALFIDLIYRNQTLFT